MDNKIISFGNLSWVLLAPSRYNKFGFLPKPKYKILSYRDQMENIIVQKNMNFGCSFAAVQL